MNFAFSGNAEERAYLGLDKGKSDLNLASLDAKYFLLLLVEEGHAENAQAVLVLMLRAGNWNAVPRICCS